jgi:hypothetical protein
VRHDLRRTRPEILATLVKRVTCHNPVNGICVLRTRLRRMFNGGGLHPLVNPTGSRLWRMDCRLQDKFKPLSFNADPEVTLNDVRARQLKR